MTETRKTPPAGTEKRGRGPNDTDDGAAGAEPPEDGQERGSGKAGGQPEDLEAREAQAQPVQTQMQAVIRLPGDGGKGPSA